MRRILGILIIAGVAASVPTEARAASEIVIAIRYLQAASRTVRI
jgi:hypothetical protein